MRTIVETLLAARLPMLVAWGPNRTLIYNDGFRALLGAKHPVALGEPVTEVWGDRPELLQAVGMCIDQAVAVCQEEVLVPIERATGHVEDAWFSVHGSPLRDETGAVSGALVTSFDTTRSKHAEQRQAFLLNLIDRIRELEDPTDIRLTACRLLGEHLGVNRCHYADIDSEALLLRPGYVNGVSPMPEVLPLAAFGSSLIEAYRRGESVAVDDVNLDTRLTASERQAYASLEVTAYAGIWLVKAGRPVGAFGVDQATPRHWSRWERELIHEVAERIWSAVQRARAEQGQRRLLQQREDLLAALTGAIAEANRANQAKDDFLATLGHELRTPLSAILLWAGALKSRQVPESDFERAFEAILRSAHAQSRLIEDLLDLSRLATGKLVLAPRRTMIESVARTAIELVQGAAQAKGIGLELVIRDYLGPAVLDASRFQQVLLNLLSNAIKFTPAGGKATLCVAKREHHLEAIVSDNGRGIAADFMPHVFERFRQGEGGDTRQQSGLGIGLALSRQLVELHGGSIEAHSAGEGQGTTFTVRIPWIEADDEPEETPSAALRARVADSPLRGLTVLLVEDDANTREALEWTLTRAGGSVVAASSASETLELLDAVHQGKGGAIPDVIVSDLGLPGTSGYDLIRMIARRRRERGLSPIPACAVSAHARDVDRQRALDAGFDMYLTKPVVPEKLIEAVRDLRDVGRATA